MPFNPNPKPSETQNDNFYPKSKHNFKFPQILDIPDSKIPKILNPRDPNQLTDPTPIPKSKSQVPNRHRFQITQIPKSKNLNL